MSWDIDIALQDDSTVISLSDLESIEYNKKLDSSKVKITEFKSFSFPGNQMLTFVSKGQTVVLHSSEIKYLNLTQD